MATYNSMATLSVAAGSGSDNLGLSVGVNHQSNGASLGLDAFEHDMTFDDTLLDNVNGLPLPFTPSYDFETFSTTFEDPFQYSGAAAGRPFELPQHNPEGFHESESPQDEGLDNKLLGFSAPVIKAAVVDEASQFSEPVMTAELFGMFFLAEDVYSAENTGRPLELTCYRRNLWWCSGQITLPRQITHIVTDQGRQVAVLELAASISAVESIEGKTTEIICIPWKSTAANGQSNGSGVNGGNSSSSNNNGHAQQSEETKAAGFPPNLPIDLANGQELETGQVSVPVSWKRLQFKHATANNGRRKGQQQHYVVQIALLGRIQAGSGISSIVSSSDNGDWLKIAEIQSGPVIVRGRSPRNFVSRRDVPLTGNSTGVDKKQIQQQQQQQALQQQQQQQPHHHTQQQQLDRHSLPSNGTMDASILPSQQHRSSSGAIDMAQNFQRYSLLGNMPQSGEWAQPYAPPQQSPHPAKRMALSPTQSRPPVPAWSKDTPSKPPTKAVAHPQGLKYQLQRPSSAAAVPLNLSLSEDERSPSAGADPALGSPPYSSIAGISSIALPQTAPMNAASSAPGSGAAASAAGQSDAFENGDLLYEYFPLSLDDWMPPVDAIYRPHVVHHTVVPPEVKAQQVRSKTKRYFAAE